MHAKRLLQSVSIFAGYRWNRFSDFLVQSIFCFSQLCSRRYSGCASPRRIVCWQRTSIGGHFFHSGHWNHGHVVSRHESQPIRSESKLCGHNHGSLKWDRRFDWNSGPIHGGTCDERSEFALTVDIHFISIFIKTVSNALTEFRSVGMAHCDLDHIWNIRRNDHFVYHLGIWRNPTMERSGTEYTRKTKNCNHWKGWECWTWIRRWSWWRKAKTGIEIQIQNEMRLYLWKSKNKNFLFIPRLW